jgi:outer membrane protein assembly factor BamA
MQKFDSKSKKYYAGADYRISLGKRYKVDSVSIVVDSTDEFRKDIFLILSNQSWKGYFDLEKIKRNRLELENQMRNKGYYGFSLDKLDIEVDSLNKKENFYLKLSLKEPISTSTVKKYQINDIHVFIDEKPLVETDHNADFFRGLILKDSKNKYKHSLFTDAIAFRPGAYFNNNQGSISTNRLLGLGNFRLINTSFQVQNRLDSSLIDSYFYLQTLKSKSLQFEANAISRSSGLAGSQISLNWQNLNTFKAAELLKFSAKANFEIQIGGKRSDLNYTNNYRVGLDAQMNVPRLWIPKIKLDPENSKVLPKTQILVGWESFIKTGLYNLNSSRASLNYSWTRGKGIEHSFSPLHFNMLKSSNISSIFLDEIFTDPKLLVILENQFIAGGQYNLNVLPRTRGLHTYSYSGSFDFAGNFVGLVDLIRQQPAKKGKIFGEYFAQFVRLESEFRYKRKLSEKQDWANKIFLGLGLPYGNSLQLPFTSQFFVGGNNSLRAFRARGIGPGSYKKTGSVSENFLGNNTGDIKIELSTEYRLKLNSLLSTAAFLDAGNVWLAKDIYIYDKNALFTKDFLRQFAVGTGIGIRLDFSFVIARLDIGTPVYKPYEENGRRFSLNQVNLLNKSWRSENLIWNIGVGLPF